MKTYLPKLGAVIAALSAITASRAAESTQSELQALREQIAALEHKLTVLERKQEIQDERVAVNDRGNTISSPDATNSIRVRGLVQFDSRFYVGSGGPATDSFLLRRARLIAEGTFAKNFTFQVVPEFGGGTGTAASAFSILDANLGITVKPSLQLKFGKVKVPVGLELLQSDSWTFFNERSLVTNLVPNRDIGALATGDLAAGRLNYAVGIFNGVADGASSTNSDFDNGRDLVARLAATPFKNTTGSPLQGLVLGLSGSYGRQKGTSGRTAGYRTDTQQTFFAYSAPVLADGVTWRVSPHVDFRRGSFGLASEYVVSAINARPTATGAKSELQNKAWQISAGYVLTGEASSYAGVVPRTNFDRAAGTWGAFEVVARYANLKIDRRAFPLFASAATNADEASAVGAGVNWYLSKSVRASFDYYHTVFGGTAARAKERALITRLQLAF